MTCWPAPQLKNFMAKTDNITDEVWIDVVREKVSGIRFGSVQITVHEGRVTQVESLEKTRFATARETPAGGSKTRAGSEE